jgi:HK97 gp10 family phage protein
MTLVLRVGGVQDTLNAFRDLPRAIRNRHMRIAMNAGAGVIRDAAVANAPKQSGLLKKSLKIKVRVPDASYNVKHHGKPAYAVIGPARGVVGRVATIKGVVKTITTRQAIKRSFGGGGFTTRRPARYAHLVEKGTRAHGIKATNAKVLSDGATVFGRAVKHPGTKAQSFLAKAVRSSGAAAQGKVIAKLKDGITDWAQARAVRARVGKIRSVADFINARALLGS